MEPGCHFRSCDTGDNDMKLSFIAAFERTSLHLLALDSRNCRRLVIGHEKMP